MPLSLMGYGWMYGVFMVRYGAFVRVKLLFRDISFTQSMWEDDKI